MDAPHGHEKGLSGRKEESARLGDLVRAHAKLCVVGPLGIGKTALVREVVSREHRAGWIAAPVWVSLASAEDARTIAERTARAMGRALGRGADVPDTLRALLDSAPRAVVWDDAQGADAASLARLVDAVEPAGSARLLVLSRRPIERRSLPLFVVPPLSPQDALELIDRLERERGSTLQDALVRRSGGNPLAVRHAIGAPEISFDDVAAARSTLDELGPGGVAALSLELALDGLVPGTELGRLVPVAAATRERLRELGWMSSGEALHEVANALVDAIRAQMPQAPPSSWEALSVASELALADAPDDGEALALACRARVERGEVAAALAMLEHHSLARHSMPTQTLRSLLASMMRADARHATRIRIVLASEQMRRGDVEAALRGLDEAAPMASSAESEARIRVVRARALARARGVSLAHDELERAAESSTSGADDVSTQLAFLMLALLRGELRASRRSLGELATRTRSVPALECRRALAFALSYFLEERFERAAAWARRARRAQGRAGVRPSLVGAIEVLALLHLDLVGRAIALVDREVEDLDVADAEEPLVAEMPQLYAAAVRGRRGDLAGCLQLVDGLFESLARRGDEITRAFLASYMARAALGLGQLDRAEHLLDTARGVAGEGGFSALSPLLDREAALVAEARGDDATARERMRTAVAARPGSPFIRIDAWALGATSGCDAGPIAGRSAVAYAALRSAERALAVGAPRDAIVPARDAEAHARREGTHVDRARALAALAEGLARVGEHAEARVAAQQCETIAIERGLSPLAAVAALVQAAIADRTGAFGDYLDALARFAGRVGSTGDRVAAALERVGMRASGRGRSALDARVARLGLDRPATRVQATDAATYLLSEEEALPHDSRLTIALDHQLVHAGDRRVPMTQQQIALLEFLCTAGGASLEDLYVGVLGGRRYSPQRHRSTVYVALARLRAALEPIVGADAILERGEGRYRISRQLRASVVCALADVPTRSGIANLLRRTPLSRTAGEAPAPPESGPPR